MEKEFAPYDLALALKELGFKEKCLASFYTYDIENFKEDKFDYRGKFIIDYSSEDDYIINTDKSYYIAAPTFYQAFSWFKKEYGLYSWIQLHNGYIDDSFYPELPITFSIMDRKTGNKYYERDIPHNYLYNTTEEAELACLKKLISIIKVKL